MIHAAHAPDPDVRGIFLGQVLLVALVFAIWIVFGRFAEALDALYGGAIALAGSWLAYRSISRTVSDAFSAAALYGGLTLRLTAVIALFAIAFGVLGLAPLPVVTGFLAAQLASCAIHLTHHR